jgi:hypothetical protein
LSCISDQGARRARAVLPRCGPDLAAIRAGQQIVPAILSILV